MKFRSFFDRPSSTVSPSGSPFRKLYTRKVDTAGNRSLIASGEENVYQGIQLAARGNLTQDLINRATRGDSTALGDVSDSFADITEAPKTLLDAELRLIKAREIFESFPVDVRNKYNNNFSDFLRAVDSGSYLNDAKAEASARSKAVKDAELVAKSTPPISDDVLAYIQKNINSGGHN